MNQKKFYIRMKLLFLLQFQNLRYLIIYFFQLEIRLDEIVEQRFDKYIIIIQEIFKVFMNKTSLKRLIVTFTYPGARSYLRILSELYCYHIQIYILNYFYPLSQI